MTENTTTGFKTEGQPAFPVENTGDATSAASSAGQTNDTNQTQSQEGDQTQAGDSQNTTGSKDGGGKDDDFVKHPRWQERENDWTKRFNDQETRHTEEMSKITEGIQATVSAAVAEALKAAGVSPTAPAAASNTGAPVQIPAWFGGDEAAWAEFKSWNDSQLAQAESRGAEKALKGIEEKSAAEQKAIDDATKYFTDTVTALEADKAINPQGVKIDRNKLLKFTMDNDLVDSKGRWNYAAAFKMMQAGAVTAKAADTKDRKDLASATTSENRAEPRTDTIASSASFQKPGSRPW